MYHYPMLQIKLDLKALSYNSYRRFNKKTGNTYLTAKGKKYVEELALQLNKYDHSLRLFGRDLIKDVDMVDMEIYYFMSDFWTKKDTVSKAAGDVDNPNKVLIDKIFERMGWDDYILGRLSCEKIPFDRDCVVVRITSYPLDRSIESLTEVIEEYLENLSSKRLTVR